jgi:hypothetical protein
MLFHKLACERPWKSDTVRRIARATLLAVIVSASTVIVSHMLGYPAPPGVAGTMGAVCASTYLIRK